MAQAQAQTKSNGRVRVAAPARNAPQPAFTVRQVDGSVKRTIYFYDEKGKRQSSQVEEPIGFVVSFPKGHTIRVKSEAELSRLGYDQSIPLVDANDDIHGYEPNNIFGRDNDDTIIDLEKL